MTRFCQILSRDNKSYYWLSLGEVTATFNWLPGEPAVDGQCVMYGSLFDTAMTRYDGWAVADCSARANYICEIGEQLHLHVYRHVIAYTESEDLRLHV